MPLRVVGAGLGRTGTLSLKVALEKLLGAPCYHMAEVFAHPEHVGAWHAAARGDMPDWKALFRGYAAAVDWPAASFWSEIGAAFPDAIVLLSLRDPESWWKSASTTIFPASRSASGPWREMVDAMFASRFTSALDDRDACIAAFERHLADVRRRVPRERLLEWRATDGWGPLCRALGVAVPDEAFPRVNTSEEFAARAAALAQQAGGAVLEVAVLDVRAGAGAAFERAFGEARRVLASMPGHQRHELRRCVERADRYLLLVWWDSLEAHTEGFRGSPEYARWKALLHPFCDPFPTVEHYAAPFD